MIRPIDMDIETRLLRLRDPDGYMRSGEVAKLLGISNGTAGKLFDKGVLKGFRLPVGKRQRKFFRRSVFRVALELGFKVAREEFLGVSLLGVGLGSPELFWDELSKGDYLKVISIQETQALSFELGMYCAVDAPDICILDSRELGVEASRQLAENFSRNDIPVIGLSKDPAALVTSAAFAELFLTPCNPVDVLTLATKLAGA